MNIRVKASKDIKRLTEERNSALHEYSVIMSEREEIHREMEKLQARIMRIGYSILFHQKQICHNVLFGVS